MRNWRSSWKQHVKALLGLKRVEAISASYVLWHGPSALTGEHIMVLASCTRRPSENDKTGDMVQIAILPVDVAPIAAWHGAAIRSICPEACPHRSDKAGDCYVNWAKLRRMWEIGRTKLDSTPPPAGFWKGAIVRLGMAGDPAAVPFHVWETIASEAKGWTGYTADWRRLSDEAMINRDSQWSRLFMASCSSVSDILRARSRGWRVYASSLSSSIDSVFEDAGLVECLATSHGVSCAACRGCDGTAKGSKRKGYYIPLHGAVGGKRRRLAEGE